MGKGSGNCEDRPGLAMGMLESPTPKQEEILLVLAEDAQRFIDTYFFDISIDARTPPTLNLHAINARLVGLRNKGWLTSHKAEGNTFPSWELTPAAKEALSFFADN